MLLLRLVLTNVNFYNNDGGVSIDGLGQSGWNVAIDGMAFEYNTGASHYQTPLHLDFTGASKNYQITNLLFNQNDGYGLSLSGVGPVGFYGHYLYKSSGGQCHFIQGVKLPSYHDLEANIESR